MLENRSAALSRTSWLASTARLFRLVLASFIILGLGLLPRQTSTAQTSWQWYKTDLHAHSVISADAYTDLGILSQSAKSLGYNALFLTDHNLASDFPISSLTANFTMFEDSYTRWNTGTYGSTTSAINSLAGTPINSGTKSLHLASSASGSGETYIWNNRGPNFRSGDIILKFSVYPTRIDPGSGVYVSASIGGDMTVGSPSGYTTSSGVISPGKSIVLVWQLGTARAASSDPNRRVLTYPLDFTLNTWNHYTINISQYLADIPAEDRPLDYNGLTYLKLTAAANAGTADAYFDTYSIKASAPVAPADEFVYRNSLIHTYDTASFKIFPALEMGVRQHAQRLSFGIGHPSEFLSYWNGIDGILPAQQSGYPAMLNHPGSDGGVTDQEAISTQGEGADLMEVRQDEWIENWDAILQQGAQLLGAGTTDTHRVFSGSSFATYVYGTDLAVDSIIHSIFEGRSYVAEASFGDQGRLIFNLDGSSQEPYPARYPVYVPGTQTSASVHVRVTGGLRSGYIVRWIRNGVRMATDSTSGSTYETTKTIPLDGPWTYVRAEIRDSSGNLKALTQPLMFFSVPELPADKSFYLASVSTADGRKYTKLFIKGITASTWDATGQALTLTLNNPAGALVDMRVTTAAVPQSIQLNGYSIPNAASLAAFQASPGSSWYYGSGQLFLKALQAGDSSTLSLWFSDSYPTPLPSLTPTSTPTQTASPSTLTFTPAADTYVRSDQPTTNFGASSQLLADGSPVKNIFLKFTVSGVGARTIVNARLRLYCTNSSASGGTFYRVADTTWSEGTVNWDTAPVADLNSLATLGVVASGTWYEVDVSSLVQGDGTYSLKLSSTSADGSNYSSKEGTAGFAPQLIVTTSTDPVPTSTNTAT
ncbi:MAG TPA: DNRLRE domain-containing protein, partial [Anaerolineales bacterium]